MSCRDCEPVPAFAQRAALSLALLIVCTTSAAAQSPPYFNDGLRWIGTADACVAPVEWTAERVFRTAQRPELAGFCLYTWSGARGTVPTTPQITKLFAVSAAQGVTEDVPVVFASAAFTPEEQALFAGLRGALRVQVGDASLLPGMPATPRARVVVIDSAPDASAGHVVPGASRHGDTLAHLIEDLVCRSGDTPDSRRCAVEVTTELALPWIARGVPGPSGGHIGTLSDVARAIERAIATWQSDRSAAPATTPGRLILNLSLGWEHTAQIADCTTDPRSAGAPARAVLAILQYAAAQGALIIAAAGNDSGGPAPRTGLTCPGRYQAVAQDADPSRSLVIAVSGVDYQDRPLETARPGGIAGIAGLGVGGVAWTPADPAPPQLTGSSVSAAVASAVAALVWTQRPSWTPGQIVAAVHAGGSDVGAADACPLSLPQCRSHRVSVCGALVAAGVPASCAPPAPRLWSCPALPAETAALAAAYATVPSSAGAIVSPAATPRHAAPTVQTEPSVFPQPISGTCPTCWIDAASLSTPYLTIPALGQNLRDAAVVVRVAGGSEYGFALGTLLLAGTSYAFPLPSGWAIQSATITGFDDAHLYSVTEQIFVER
jgi:hypothetical protein